MVKHWVRLEKVTRSNPYVVGIFQFASFLHMKRIWLDLWKELASNLTRVLDRVIYFNIPPPGVNRSFHKFQVSTRSVLFPDTRKRTLNVIMIVRNQKNVHKMKDVLFQSVQQIPIWRSFPWWSIHNRNVGS